MPGSETQGNEQCPFPRCGRGCSCGPSVAAASRVNSAGTHHSTHDTYSPVGRRNRRMYWSWLQSTGAEMRKYFTVGHC
jgi:hypothetical protein